MSTTAERARRDRLPAPDLRGDRHSRLRRESQAVPFAIARGVSVAACPPGVSAETRHHKGVSPGVVWSAGVCNVLATMAREEVVRATGPGTLLYVPPMIWASEPTSSKIRYSWCSRTSRIRPGIRADYDEYLRLRGSRAEPRFSSPSSSSAQASPTVSVPTSVRSAASAKQRRRHHHARSDRRTEQRRQRRLSDPDPAGAPGHQ